MLAFGDEDESDEPAEHFYSYAFRFRREMFSRLIDPLMRDGSMRLLADFTEERATAYRKHLYSFEGVDVVLLGGIFCSNGSSSSDTTSVSGSIVASRWRWSGPSLTRGTRALRYDCCL